MADEAGQTQASAEPDAEIHRADPAERKRTLAITLVVAICGALLLAAMQHELGTIQERLVAGDADHATSRFLWLARGSFVLLALVGVVTGVLLARAASAVIREQRYPHAAARLIRDRTVVRGARAVLIGRLGMGIALAFMVVGCLGAVTGWQLLTYFE